MRNLVAANKNYFSSIEGGKEMIAYELVLNKGRQRLYKLNESITKDRKGKAIKYNGIETKIKYVLISDAHTHLERLAFPAKLFNCESDVQTFSKSVPVKSTLQKFKDEKKEKLFYVEYDPIDIGGNISWLIDGWGESNARLLMTDDEILTEIIQANCQGK